MVRYFGNLSNIDDRVRNISWQTLNLTQTLTLTLILTLILTLTLNPNLIHTYLYTAIYVRQVAEIVYGQKLHEHRGFTLVRGDQPPDLLVNSHTGFMTGLTSK